MGFMVIYFGYFDRTLSPMMSLARYEFGRKPRKILP